jgi:alpha-ketoglutarate-dependent taurine dioxygenase
MIEVIPLSEHVGAELRGIDFSREIYAAWLKHLVLVIRDQQLTADDQQRFTLMFGEIQPPRSRPGQRDPNNPVMWIANATIDGQRGELPEGDMQFHADQCYYENPAKGAVLYGIEIPSKGGNTLFSSSTPPMTAWPPKCASVLSGCRSCSFTTTRKMPTARRPPRGPTCRAIFIQQSCGIRRPGAAACLSID